MGEGRAPRPRLRRNPPKAAELDQGADGTEDAKGAADEAEPEEGAAEEEGDAEEDDDREPGEADGDLGRRLDAVDRESEASTAWVRRVLTGMADAVAQPFVDTQAAFDRFARRHVGVGGMTLLRAWGHPHADDLAATLLAFPHVKPREEAVAELVRQLGEAWRSRLGEEADNDGR